jgi:hypothetical protein
MVILLFILYIFKSSVNQLGIPTYYNIVYKLTVCQSIRSFENSQDIGRYPKTAKTFLFLWKSAENRLNMILSIIPKNICVSGFMNS